jgi:hypothetical protein
MPFIGKGPVGWAYGFGMQAEKAALEAQLEAVLVMAQGTSQLLSVRDEALVAARSHASRLDEQLRLAVAGRCDLHLLYIDSCTALQLCSLIDNLAVFCRVFARCGLARR